MEKVVPVSKGMVPKEPYGRLANCLTKNSANFKSIHQYSFFNFYF